MIFLRHNYSKGEAGFTLVETIIYVAIAGIVLLVAVQLMLNLMQAETNVRNKQEVNHNARFAMEEIIQKIRGADDVTTASSTFNTNPGVLRLKYPTVGSDVIFDTYTKTITVGSTTTTLTKLRIKDGAADYADLTSDQVNVTNLVFRNLTRGSERKNINIELTVARVNPQNDANYNTSISLETAISLRK